MDHPRKIIAFACTRDDIRGRPTIAINALRGRPEGRAYNIFTVCGVSRSALLPTFQVLLLSRLAEFCKSAQVKRPVIRMGMEQPSRGYRYSSARRRPARAFAGCPCRRWRSQRWRCCLQIIYRENNRLRSQRCRLRRPLPRRRLCSPTPTATATAVHRAGLRLGHGIDPGRHSDALADLAATRPAGANTDTACLGMRQLSLDHDPDIPAVGPGTDGDHGQQQLQPRHWPPRADVRNLRLARRRARPIGPCKSLRSHPPPPLGNCRHWLAWIA